MGRIALIVDGHPEIFPVNFALERRSIVFRTAGGSKLWAAMTAKPVAFEIDGYDAHEQQAWSVVARGEAQLIESQQEKDAVDATTARAVAARRQGLLRAPVPQGHDRAPVQGQQAGPVEHPALRSPPGFVRIGGIRPARAARTTTPAISTGAYLAALVALFPENGPPARGNGHGPPAQSSRTRSAFRRSLRGRGGPPPAGRHPGWPQSGCAVGAPARAAFRRWPGLAAPNALSTVSCRISPARTSKSLMPMAT